MKTLVKKLLILVLLFCFVTITKSKAEVVKITDYEYYQEAVFEEIKGGWFSNAGLTTDGRLFTWGYNDKGQLGNGTYDPTYVPEDITPGMNLASDEYVTHFDVTHYTMLATTNKNRVFGWGWNNARAIGDGTTTSSNVPVETTSNFPLNVGENIIDIDAGSSAGFVLTDEGRLFSWGLGYSGVLCNGVGASVNSPTDHSSCLTLGVGEYLVDIDVQSGNALAISNQNNLYGWGLNSNGELFLGDTAIRLSAENLTAEFPLTGGELIVDISSGDGFSVVTTDLGKIFSAGLNWKNIRIWL